MRARRLRALPKQEGTSVGAATSSKRPGTALSARARTSPPGTARRSSPSRGPQTNRRRYQLSSPERVSDRAFRSSRRAPLVTMDSVSSSYEASTALPYPHLEWASAGLRAGLRHRLPTDEVADWTMLEILGPTETTDGLGRTRFEYRATMRCR